jgi:hypothetical protein
MIIIFFCIIRVGLVTPGRDETCIVCQDTAFERRCSGLYGAIGKTQVMYG